MRESDFDGKREADKCAGFGPEAGAASENLTTSCSPSLRPEGFPCESVTRSDGCETELEGPAWALFAARFASDKSSEACERGNL